MLDPERKRLINIHIEMYKNNNDRIINSSSPNIEQKAKITASKNNWQVRE